MITGEVDAERRAMIGVSVKAAGSSAGSDEFIASMIDTGFDGYLSLPLDMAQELQLPFVENRLFNLADNSTQSFAIHAAIVVWDNEERGVFALASDGPPTIGTALLYGFRLFADWVDGGEVTISARD